MKFFLKMNPPTCTAQQKKVTMVAGKPMMYDSPNLKKAKEFIASELIKHVPSEPMDGAINLEVFWLFPAGKSHKHGEWRNTKPDTDNLDKMFKDVMTKLGFWADDARVCAEHIYKIWTRGEPGILVKYNRIDPIIANFPKDGDYDIL